MKSNLTSSPVAVLHQATSPPIIDGIPKPMKPSGYSDSGADIAYTLKELGIPIVTPTLNPNDKVDRDWVFPDNESGIKQAISAGASVLWANTILYNDHPLENFLYHDIRIVGQRPDRVHTYDDKWKTKQVLQQHGCPVPNSVLVGSQASPEVLNLNTLTNAMLAEKDILFPIVIKPIRGRGSQGVIKIEDLDQLIYVAKDLIAQTVLVDGQSYAKYGKALIVEEYLPGIEVTITVMPPGRYHINGRIESINTHWSMPPVERFNHVKGIAPYNGVVAVTQNSRVLNKISAPLKELARYCEVGAQCVGAVAPIRVDCRSKENGQFYIFDLNMKPNMTGSGRPGRDDQDSLSCMAARKIDWSYGDLLKNMLMQAWQIEQKH